MLAKAKQKQHFRANRWSWTKLLTQGLLVLVFWRLTIFPSPADAAELEVIRQRGYLIAAVKDNLRPLGFRDEAGQIQGFEIDLARQLAQDLLGSSEALQLKPVANADRLSAVLEGQVDLAIAQVGATGSRQRLIQCSMPYYVDGIALVSRDATIRQLQDLTQPSTPTIAVLNGSSAISVLHFWLSKARLVGVSSYQAGYELLEGQSTVKVFAGDASVLSGWIQDHPHYHLLPTLLSAQSLCIAMPKGIQYASLHQAVNTMIRQWRTKGWLQNQISAWGLLSRTYPQ